MTINDKSSKRNIIIDFISGLGVEATPEEVEAVQVFSQRLVEEYKYDKDQIQTHPQFRVKTAPSGEEKYPVDIALFRSNKKTYNNVYAIVECKQPSRKDGLNQLNIYLNLVPSVEIGIWFNGKEHLYLRKIIENGIVAWQEMSDIPKRGERIEDIGLYKRKNLDKPKNLKSLFNDIRNHLAGNTTGITRDEAIAQQIIHILFCKLWDEINTAPEDTVEFRAGVGEDKGNVKRRIEKIFYKVKKEYDDVFEIEDSILLDDASLVYVVGQLQKFCIIGADRDALGDAFEVFIDPALRGGEGQFFTPRNVVKMIVDMLDPDIGDYVIDPACGSGGFLVVALEHSWNKLELEGRKKNWSLQLLAEKKKELATKYFCGIDKDSFLAKVSKAYMAIIGDGRGGIFCDNSLLDPNEWKSRAPDKIKFNKFNILLTNPPFGDKIPIKGDSILGQYHLGHKWKLDKNRSIWMETNKLADKRPPQILFIERCLQLLAPGGRMGIVLPDSIIGNQSDGYIRDFILSQAKLLAVVDCPQETFLPSTSTKTSVVLLEKKDKASDEDYEIFMAIAEKCGHDRRGKYIYKSDPLGNSSLDDDLPEIANEYNEFRNKKNAN